MHAHHVSGQRARAPASVPAQVVTSEFSASSPSNGRLQLIVRHTARWWYHQRFPQTHGHSSLRERCLGDLVAGIIVATLLIPSGMAYAMIAGLPPYVGLYASVVPLLVYAAFGSSTCLSVGPVTVVSLLVASSLAPLAPLGSPAYLANAIALATLSGVFLLALGWLRLGYLANLLSHPVLLGFTTGVGLVIVVNQLKTILGVSAAASDFLPLQLWNVLAAAARLNPVTLLIGVSSISILWFRAEIASAATARGWCSKPAALHLSRGMPLVVVALGAVVTWTLGLANAAGVAVVGAIPAGMVPLTWPLPTDANWLALILPAMLLSLIGFVEGISIAKRLEPIGDAPLAVDRELMAVGAANLAAAFTGGYPVSGGTARTALNHSAGAVTPLANAWSAVVVLLCLLLLAPLIYHLPTAALAAIITTACAALINFQPFLALRQTSPDDAAAFAITCTATVCCGAKWGLAVGVASSICVLARRAARANVHAVVQGPADLTLYIDGWLNFANAAAIEAQIEHHLAAAPGLSRCTVYSDPAHTPDATGHHMLAGLKQRLAQRAIELVIADSPTTASVHG
jgi:sulfate permease, SulP family